MAAEVEAFQVSEFATDSHLQKALKSDNGLVVRSHERLSRNALSIESERPEDLSISGWVGGA